MQYNYCCHNYKCYNLEHASWIALRHTFEAPCQLDAHSCQYLQVDKISVMGIRIPYQLWCYITQTCYETLYCNVTSLVWCMHERNAQVIKRACCHFLSFLRLYCARRQATNWCKQDDNKTTSQWCVGCNTPELQEIWRQACTALAQQR